MSLIAVDLAFPETASKLWDDDVATAFMLLAEKVGMTTEVLISFTYRENDRVQNGGVKISFPQGEATVSLAKGCLQKALEIFDERSPAAELLAIRGSLTRNGSELFRYDLGPGIGR